MYHWLKNITINNKAVVIVKRNNTCSVPEILDKDTSVNLGPGPDCIKKKTFKTCTELATVVVQFFPWFKDKIEPQHNHSLWTQKDTLYTISQHEKVPWNTRSNCRKCTLYPCWFIQLVPFCHFYTPPSLFANNDSHRVIIYEYIQWKFLLHDCILLSTLHPFHSFSSSYLLLLVFAAETK